MLFHIVNWIANFFCKRTNLILVLFSMPYCVNDPLYWLIYVNVNQTMVCPEDELLWCICRSRVADTQVLGLWCAGLVIKWLFYYRNKHCTGIGLCSFGNHYNLSHKVSLTDQDRSLYNKIRRITMTMTVIYMCLICLIFVLQENNESS